MHSVLRVGPSALAHKTSRARNLSPVFANGTLPSRRQRRRHCGPAALRASTLVAARSPQGQHGRSPRRCSRSWCVKPAPRSAPLKCSSRQGGRCLPPALCASCSRDPLNVVVRLCHIDLGQTSRPSCRLGRASMISSFLSRTPGKRRGTCHSPE